MIEISPMTKKEIADAIELWNVQFKKYCLCDEFPNFIDGGEQVIESYLKSQIEIGNAVIAKKDNSLVGYLAWMYFDFHSERSAFLPTVGHAASFEDETNIYKTMYRYAAHKWIDDHRFNHLWMMYYDDVNLKECLYELGFGSYVFDACQRSNKVMKESNSSYTIRMAQVSDADHLLEVANESNDYYLRSPIFVRKKAYVKSEIISRIENGDILIALDDKKIVGVMSFSVNKKYHIEYLTTLESARIEYIGAYICPDYRGKGIGKALLGKVLDICKEEGKEYVHVSYESANENATYFWPKYLKPAIRSVRRTINKDSNRDDFT